MARFSILFGPEPRGAWMAALRAAVGDSDVEGLRALLAAAGVDADARDAAGYTALHHAALHGRRACLEALLAAGASSDSVNVSSFTPLHFASIHGDVACVRALVAAGADVSRADGYGFTAFSNALRVGCRSVLKVLLRAGAAVDSRRISRCIRNVDAWATVDAIRRANGWATYADRHRANAARIVFKATRGVLPHVINVEIAAFATPLGGY